MYLVKQEVRFQQSVPIACGSGISSMSPSPLPFFPERFYKGFLQPPPTGNAVRGYASGRSKTHAAYKLLVPMACTPDSKLPTHCPGERAGVCGGGGGDEERRDLKSSRRASLFSPAASGIELTPCPAQALRWGRLVNVSSIDFAI